MKKYALIIPAAGQSVRMGGVKKQFIKLGGEPVLVKSVKAFSFMDFSQIIVACPAEDREKTAKILNEAGIKAEVVEGGKTRQESVFNAVCKVNSDTDFVLIHDAARPFVSKDVIKGVCEKLEDGALSVIPCVKPKDTIRTADKTLKRDELYVVQTPQGFEYKTLISAFKKAVDDGIDATDDAGICEYSGVKTVISEGDYKNIKITTPEDLPKQIRFGQGYDVHVLVEGRKLMLGCIEVPFEKGLLGHSDADVLSHAIADAILGACALGDIGKHFPDTDPAYEGISGTELLKKVCEICKNAGFTILSADATLVAQKPKISPYTESMREAVARAIGIDKNKVSIKATTEEGRGVTGKGEAMAAYATATVEEY